MTPSWPNHQLTLADREALPADEGLRLELLEGPTTLLAYTLVNGHHELSGEHSGAVTLDVAGHPVTLDALTTR